MFVKLDCGILDSSIWPDREARDLFITALLMATPRLFSGPQEQLHLSDTAKTGYTVPAGWYGFVPASSTGILRRAGMADQDAGLAALERLGSPEGESRSPDFEGRRMIRVDGGFLVLNYQKYRDQDHTAASRMKAYRARQREKANGSDDVTRNVTSRTSPVTQAEGEVQGEAPPPCTNSAPPALSGVGQEGPKPPKPQRPKLLPTTPEAKAIADLYKRRHTTPWAAKEVRQYQDLMRRQVLTMEALGVIAAYYESERAMGKAGGKHNDRRDLYTFLNNFDGELDRARAFIADPQSNAQRPNSHQGSGTSRNQGFNAGADYSKRPTPTGQPQEPGLPA